MKTSSNFFVYLFAMAAVTYLIRAVPLIFIKKKIKNVYVVSFLKYMPYAVLSVMTVPACFYATGNIVSGAVGFCVACFLAIKDRSLLEVAAGASVGVLIVELIMNYA